jgi:hypothetical protein
MLFALAVTFVSVIYSIVKLWRPLVDLCARIFLVVLMFGAVAGTLAPRSSAQEEALFDRAAQNGRLAAEGFERCHRYVTGWLKHADPETGLIPRNLSKGRNIWNAPDAAADNYPFMVLTAALIDRPLFEGRMLEMLKTEKRLTARIGSLPDTYTFKVGLSEREPDLKSIFFGASEYIKDGLLPITEWLGPSPWSERMIAMLDDMWQRAPVDTPHGKIVSESHEINGEMLQALSRVYWMTGEKRYLDWALRLGDYYLLDKNLPTRDVDRLRLRDHGCEIVSGLCELYATVHFAQPEKKKAYQKPIHAMLDRILVVGRNKHGLFYNNINPKTGTHDAGVADTWGYTLNGFYTVYLLDGTTTYRDATRKALNNIKEHYTNYRWEGSSADGYADSIEGCLYLVKHEPVQSAMEWIDTEIQVLWSKQQEDGVIEGWHGDGNFARTTLMYCLWKTQGLSIQPWRKDVVFGAVREGDQLSISIQAERPWQGTLRFDAPRHRTQMKLPLDWPRINQFPEWYPVDSDKEYRVRDLDAGTEKVCAGQQLHAGLAVDMQSVLEKRLVIR